MKLFSVLLLLCEFLLIHGSKILVLTSFPAHSHYTLAFRMAEELAKRNHQVTFVNAFPQKTPIKNLREISLVEMLPWVNEVRKSFTTLGQMGVVGSHLLDLTVVQGLVEYTFNNTEVQKLLNSKETFDVVLVEHYMNEAFVGFGYHFKAPVILLASVGSCFRNNYIYGNPGPSSYVPDLLGDYSKHMNFWQRLKNFVMINTHEIVRELGTLPVHRQLFKKYITSDVELDEVLHNISLILTISHPSVNDAVPHLPNIVEVGGYHLSPPKKLPQDLQTFLDDAKEGVVLFSMGSNLKSKDLSLEVRRAILNSFSKIKAKVLWKFEENLPEAPKNVKIMSWLPQQDVLGHPNVKCFITHGGLLSNIEAVYYGVPLIGIPVFSDQYSNVAAVVGNGYGLSVRLDDLTEENFSAALQEILTNPKYMNNVKKRSAFMHDQPLKQMDLAVYWIEHVIRHGGAPFLKSAATDLSWYQRELIDVIAFIGLTALVFLIVSYHILKCVVRRVFRNEKKNITIKKKKKQ